MSNNFEHCHVYTTDFLSSKIKFIHTSTVTRSHSCYGKKLRVRLAYILLLLKQLGLGCHVGLIYDCAFGYADDIALVAPSLYCLKKMISTCETFANKYSISFNPSKSKLLCFNVDSSNVAPVFINRKRVEVVQSDVHLGNYISTNITDRNIVGHVCDLHQRSNSVISDFNVCDSVSLHNLHQTYCMHMYGCKLWNLSCSYVSIQQIYCSMA